VPIYYDYREDTNGQYNFLDFVLAKVASNQFANGDYLIVDNAAVHHGSATYDLIVKALDSVGCKLIFLPAYSPELNSCKLCFAIVKNYIRKRLTDPSIPIWSKILWALTKINFDMLRNFFKHCIYPPYILPELH
jgi:transposase